MAFSINEHLIDSLTILVSLAAFIFSIISFIRSQRMKRIENYLHFGSIPEIDLQISQLENKKRYEIQNVVQQFEQKKTKLDSELADSNALNSSSRISGTKRLENDRDKDIDAINTDFDSQIKLLQMKKENIARL